MQSLQNQNQLDPVALREFFLSAPESDTARVIAIVLSASLLVSILMMVRGRHLREEYTPIWVFVALGMLVVSVRMDFLQMLTRAIGAWTPSSAILFFGVIFLVLLSLNYAARLSKYGVDLKNLVQENALLRERLDRLESKSPDVFDLGDK